MTRFCDQCGAELKPKAMFCSKCGAKSDLPPEINVENKSGEEQVNNTVDNNTEQINKNVNETVNNATNNRVNNTNTKNANFDVNNIDWNVVLKYSIASTIVSTVIGFILFYLFYGTPIILYNLVIGSIISILLFTAHIEDKTNAIVTGFVVGLLLIALMIFQTFVFIPFLFYGRLNTSYILFIGPICGYIGNVYLKDKINFPVINQYLGE